MRRSRIVLLVLLAGLAGLGAWLGVRWQIRRSQRGAFDGSLAEFTRPVEGRISRSLGEPGAVAGKLLLIDLDQKQVDDLQFELPDELRALRPEEVGTVVWIKREMSSIKVGTTWRNYQFADLTFIRRETWIAEGAKHISGGTSGGSRGSTEPWNGTKPVREIVDYLTSLPRE